MFRKLNPMNNGINNKLKEFVINQSAVNQEEITRETYIEIDLGIYGDDAYEFLIAFGKEFNVDISKFSAKITLVMKATLSYQPSLGFLQTQKK